MMDTRDICSLKDKTKMDTNTVWQWRIMLAKKYSRYLEPLRYSSKMGLDFNVGSNTQEKLDFHSVSNGVILEICDFAKIINRSKGHVITNILENNFDLGLKNDQERTDFAAQILHKVRELIKEPPKNKYDVFPLFDTLSEHQCTSSSKTGVNNMASREHKTHCWLVEIYNIDNTEDESELGSQIPFEDYIKTEEIDGSHVDSLNGDEFECSRPQSVEELKEDVLPTSLPYCEEAGLKLDVGSKQSLDPLLITKGIMLELVHFTRVLTSYNSIVLGVLEHNFEIDVKSQQGKNKVWFKVLNLLKSREQLFAEFKNEPFSFQNDSFKKGTALFSVGAQLDGFEEVTKRRQSDLKIKGGKRALSPTGEHTTKRSRRESSEQKQANIMSHDTDLCTSQTAEDDHCYLSLLDPDEATDSDSGENELQNPGSSDITRESESSPLRVCTPLLTTTHASSSLPIVNLNINTSLACQPDKRGRCGDEEEPQMPTNVSSECHMEQEEREIESNMWKLRANQVKQILLHDEYCAFNKSKKHGIEFNVGFGPKQNIDVDSLTNVLLLEVAKFALAMNSSQQDFIMEILEYNFDLGLQNEYHRKIFACDLMTRVRQLQNSEDTVKFSRQIFELPGLVSSGNITNESMDSVNPELSSISREAECDVAPMCPLDSHTEAKEHIDLYCFCKDIGLKLHVNHSRPNKKLEISKLSNGAMTEVTVFAEKLCGTFEQICLDIIRHNFDLDSQSGDSDQARNILMQIPLAMEQKHLLTCLSSSIKYKHKLLAVENLECQNSPNVEPSSTSSYQAPITDQNIGSCTDTEQEHEVDLGLWKLRANQIQQLLSVPHGENCPLYSYSRCRKVGLDFNIGSGVKQNLDPKLLTNGIMVEIHTFATALISAEKEFITEILEYNFHLDLKSELHRTVFAQKLMNKFRATLKCNKIRLLDLPFELPDSRCIEESSYPKAKYCPKCYKDRNSNLHQDVSDPGHELHPRPHTKADTVSAEPICSAQSPAENMSTTAAETMVNYPRCKKIGVTLCLNEDQPKDKLSTQLLTRGVVNEVARYAKKLCGTRNQIVNDIIKHNFNFGMQSRDINPGEQFARIRTLHYNGPNWFNEVFVVQPSSKNLADVSKVKKVSVMQKNERKETFKKRQLALQTKKVRTTVPRNNMTVEKPKSKRPRGDCFPFCTEIGLDLDVTSKPNGKKKLDFNLLTKAVVMEIYRFVVKKKQHYFPSSLYDILDYNFDLRSQHDRKWEFALSTASKVKTMVRNYKTNLADVIFQLPFVLEHSSSKSLVQKSQTKKSSMPLTDEPHKTTADSKFVQTAVRSCSENPWWNVKDNTLINPWAITQMNDTSLRAGCDIPQGNIQIKEEEYEPNFGDMNLELDPEKEYHPYSEDAKTESNIVNYLAPGEPTGSLGHTLLTICPNYEINITGESENAHFSMLAEPQASEGYAMHAVCPNTQSSEEITLSTESLKYLVPVQTAESQGYSVITICQEPQSIVIKEEQDNVPVDSSQYGLVSYTESGVDVKQE